MHSNDRPHELGGTDPSRALDPTDGTSPPIRPMGQTELIRPDPSRPLGPTDAASPATDPEGRSDLADPTPTNAVARATDAAPATSSSITPQPGSQPAATAESLPFSASTTLAADVRDGRLVQQVCDAFMRRRGRFPHLRRQARAWREFWEAGALACRDLSATPNELVHVACYLRPRFGHPGLLASSTIRRAWGSLGDSDPERSRLILRLDVDALANLLARQARLRSAGTASRQDLEDAVLAVHSDITVLYRYAVALRTGLETARDMLHWTAQQDMSARSLVYVRGLPIDLDTLCDALFGTDHWPLEE